MLHRIDGFSMIPTRTTNKPYSLPPIRNTNKTPIFQVVLPGFGCNHHDYKEFMHRSQEILEEKGLETHWICASYPLDRTQWWTTDRVLEGVMKHIRTLTPEGEEPIVHVHGHSMGGVAGAQTANKYEEIEGVTLICGTFNSKRSLVLPIPHISSYTYPKRYLSILGGRDRVFPLGHTLWDIEETLDAPEDCGIVCIEEMDHMDITKPDSENFEKCCQMVAQFVASDVEYHQAIRNTRTKYHPYLASFDLFECQKIGMKIHKLVNQQRMEKRVEEHEEERGEENTDVDHTGPPHLHNLTGNPATRIMHLAFRFTHSLFHYGLFIPSFIERRASEREAQMIVPFYKSSYKEWVVPREFWMKFALWREAKISTRDINQIVFMDALASVDKETQKKFYRSGKVVKFEDDRGMNADSFLIWMLRPFKIDYDGDRTYNIRSVVYHDKEKEETYVKLLSRSQALAIILDL
jgi:pimeloyl-ACP methyl ester carboxylesterase